MSNESNNTSQDQVEEAVTPEVVTDEASLMDEVTQANFRIEELEQLLAESETALAERKDVEMRAAAET
ncbi:hypothetical protein, partial [Psychrobacter sp. TB55-MNA-CIBAN-0194]